MNFLARKLDGQKGLSYVEMSIAVAITVILATVTFKIFLYFQSQALIQRRISTLQSELRPARITLEKLIRESGVGMKRMLDMNGYTDRPSVEIFANAANVPDSLYLKGNYTGVKSQLRSPLTSLTNTTDLQILTGTANAFVVGQYIAIMDANNSEFTEIKSKDVVNSYLRTNARLYNYSAGATVVMSTRHQFKVTSDSSLIWNEFLTASTNKTAKLISKHVTNFKVSMKDASGNLVTDPTTAKFVLYSITMAIPTRKGKYLIRKVDGRVFIRNS